MANVTRAVHSAGGRIFLQVWHVGRVSHPSMQPGRGLPVAPSAIAPEGQLFTLTGMQRFVTPRPLTTNEIPRIVEQFAQAAQRAKDAGFDGIDVHAANGYLIDQFLRDGSNRRGDQYGGSVRNRARFLLEVVEAVAACWEADRVGVRVSPLNPYNSMRDSDPLTTFGYVAKRSQRSWRRLSARRRAGAWTPLVEHLRAPIALGSARDIPRTSHRRRGARSCVRRGRT